MKLRFSILLHIFLICVNIIIEWLPFATQSCLPFDDSNGSKIYYPQLTKCCMFVAEGRNHSHIVRDTITKVLCYLRNVDSFDN